LDKIIITVVGIFTTFSLGLIAWFFRRLIKNNDTQHQELKIKTDSLKTSIENDFKGIREEIQDNQKEIMEVNKIVTQVDAKQERLDIFSTKIDSIHTEVKKHSEFVDKVNEKVENNVREIKHIKDFIEKPIPDIDIAHILESPLLSVKEKKEIQRHKKHLLIHEPHLVEAFVKHLEEKIKKLAENKKVGMVDIDRGYRVSESLIKKDKK